MKKNLKISFPGDKPGRDVESYDFGALGLPFSVAKPMSDAFKALTSTYRSTSRRQAWNSVRKFSAYLVSRGRPQSDIRAKGVLKDFLEDMRTTLIRSTSTSHYNFIAAMYRWLGLNDPDMTIAWLNVDTSRSGLLREVESVRRRSLSKEQLSTVLAASKAGIDEFRSRMRHGDVVIGGDISPTLSAADCKHLRGMHTGLLQGVLGKGKLIEAGSIPSSARYRELRPYLLPEARDFIPYVIYIMCETLANPQSAIELSVECLREHPVDPLKRRMIWDKYRSSEQQAVDVTAEGRYAIPRLVEDIRNWTARLRPYAGQHAGRLFISPFKDYGRTPSVQSWHTALDAFIQQHDLPNFNFVDIRSSGAEILGGEGMSLQSIQARMQHNNSRTTLRYLARKPPTLAARRSVATFIGLVVGAARKLEGRVYETASGLDCLDEMSGVAPNSSAGKPCLEYLQCASCPNSVAVIDSKKHVTRMISAVKALDQMKESSFLSADVRARYEAAFRPTHEVLVKLLELVPREVLRAARTAAEAAPTIPLE